VSSTLFLPLLTALVAGFRHALEADHMAAVTTFVARRPRPMEALGFGVRWGIGHSLAILLAGGALILLDVRVPAALEAALEFAVGAMLLGLGLWVLMGVFHRGGFSAPHAQAHAEGHPHSHVHPHGRATVWVGVAHGLAGTAAFLALLPAALLGSAWLATGYLLLFGLGTVLAMGMYAVIAGLLFHHAGDRLPALGTGLRVLTAIASAVIGILWMVGAAFGG
jgi:sulfite exporter TauE/SafE